MRIAITGGTGFIGQALMKALMSLGHSGWIISRSLPDKAPGNGSTPAGGFVRVSWGQLEASPQLLNGVEAVINLAGETISQRWTETAKNRIRSSRVETAAKLADILSQADIMPKILVQASGVNAYGFSDSATFTEENPTAEEDFLASVVRDWEHAAKAIPAERNVTLRFGVVLGKDGGALPRMLLPFRMMAGGPLGSGKQWMSWIHLQDLVQLIIHSLNSVTLEGVVNATAPEPARNSEFGRAAAKALGRPYWLIAPSPPLRLALGEMSDLLLKGQRVVPAKALADGFRFQFPSIQEALDNLLARS
ncbi:hypothetical protein SAMN05444162_0939 [Paenibacillaceae bacterium GAS479]|nr:hypothetical protein SAMN05444162_0939 [Paenibacillaceae bacterium GAS479]